MYIKSTSPLRNASKRALPVPTLIRDGQTTVYSPEGEVGIRAQAEDAVIIGLRGIAPKTTTGLAIQFIGIGHFGNAADGHLCGKTKLCTTTGIRQLVQGELPKRLAVSHAWAASHVQARFETVSVSRSAVCCASGRE